MSRCFSGCFPGARGVGAAAVGRQITAIASELTQERVSRVIGGELASPITVGWSGDFASGSAGWLPIRVAIRSPYAHLPVVVNDLSVVASGGVVAEARGLPEAITLGAGPDRRGGRTRATEW